MRKNNFILLILLIVTAISGTKSYADTSRDMVLRSAIPPTVSITKTSSTENQTANSKTGVHSGLMSVFTLQTNGGDDDFDFILTASAPSSGGPVSAFGNGGRYIIFTHSTAEVTGSAIDNAKSGYDNNKNVIAYPFSISTTNPVTSSYKMSYSTYGECYKILLNGETDTSVTVSVDGTPISATYSMADQSGSYQATVTLTAFGK